MARFRFLVLSAVLCTVVALGRGDVEVPGKPVIIPVQTSQQNVQSQTTTSEDAAATTHAVTTSSSTTTTTTTTTTPVPTTSTTEASTEPPTPPPTPAPTPTPAPKPTPPTPGPPTPPVLGNWSYTEGNVTCVMVQFAAQLNVTYPIDVKNGTSFAYFLLNVPANATVANGSCDATVQMIELSWVVENQTMANTMVLQFQSNATTKQYSLTSLNVSLTPELFPNASSKAPIEFYHGAEWQTPLATSYRCKPATQLNMTAETTNVVATLTLSQLQEEAFRTTASSGFSAPRDCGGRDVPDAVPIAVGCALGGLVVVVLIAYLVGRRRSAARGYLSM